MTTELRALNIVILYFIIRRHKNCYFNRFGFYHGYNTLLLPAGQSHKNIIDILNINQ